jgi:hypothetical protein
MSSAHFQLGNALLFSGARAEAKAAYRRALVLAPEEIGAVAQLVDLQAFDGEHEDASQLVTLLEQRDPVLARLKRVRVALLAGDVSRAGEAAAAILRDPAAPSVHVTRIQRLFAYAGQAAAFEAILAKAVAGGTPHEDAAAMWMRSGCMRQGWAFGLGLRELPAGTPVAEGAARGLFTALRKSGDLITTRVMVKKLRPHVVRSNAAWAHAASALRARVSGVRAMMWLRGWRKRAELAPWMLYEVAQSARAVGLRGPMRDASRRALAAGVDQSTPLHHAWLAFDEACQGRTSSAEEHLKQAQAGQLDAVSRGMCALAEVLLIMPRAKGQNRRDAYDQACVRLGRLAAGIPSLAWTPAARDVRRTERRLAWDGRAPLDLLWSVRMPFVAALLIAGAATMLTALVYAYHPEGTPARELPEPVAYAILALVAMFFAAAGFSFMRSLFPRVSRGSYG